MATLLETARLRLRRFRDDDLAAYAAIWSDPEVMRYLGKGGARSLQESRELLAWLRATYRDGFGVWALVQRESGAAIGWAGVNPVEAGGRREIELMYLLARPHWRRGLATEAALALRDYAFAELRLPRLVALVFAQNGPSLRVVEKVGMAYERDVSLGEKTIGLFAMGPPAGGG
jgi:[ribosomal protein S5]-alanine N-acetyltransferase